MAPRSRESVAVRPLRRILFVDHAPHTRSIMSFVLARIDRYELRTCSSGPAALEAANGFNPDLVLLDVGMPGMDGLATLERLRRKGIAAPVVFFTSHARPGEIERYAARGAIGTIPKPFDPLKVPRQLEDLWRRHHLPASA